MYNKYIQEQSTERMTTISLESIYEKIAKWKNLPALISWMAYYKNTHDIDMSNEAQNRYLQSTTIQLCREIPLFPIVWSKMMSVSIALCPLTPAEIEYLYAKSLPESSDTTYRYWEYREIYSDLARIDRVPYEYSKFKNRPKYLSDMPLAIHRWEDYKEQIDMWAGNTIRKEKILFLERVLMRCPLLVRLDTDKMVEDLHGYFATDMLARYCWLSLMIVGIKEFIPEGISTTSIENMWEVVNDQLEILTPGVIIPDGIIYNYKYSFCDKPSDTKKNSL